MTAVLGEDEESADHPAFAYGRAGKKRKGKRVGTQEVQKKVLNRKNRSQRKPDIPRPCCSLLCPSYISSAASNNLMIPSLALVNISNAVQFQSGR